MKHRPISKSNPQCRHCYFPKSEHRHTKTHKFEPFPKVRDRGMTLEQLIAASKANA